MTISSFEKVCLGVIILMGLPILYMFWQPIILGIVVSIWLYPLMKKIGTTSNFRVYGVLVAGNILITLLLVTILFFGIYAVTVQASALTGTLKNLKTTDIKEWPYIGKYAYEYVAKFDVASAFKDYAGESLEKTFRWGSNIVAFGVAYFIFLVWTSFLLKNSIAIVDTKITPITDRYQILGRIVKVVYKTTQQLGFTLLTSATLATIVMGIVYYVLGFKFLAILMIITFVAATIPGGAIILFVILAITALVYFGYIQAIILLAIGILLNVFTDQVLQPVLLNKLGGKFGFSTSLIGILGGIAFFGLTGIILGPVILACGIESFQALLKIIKDSK